MTRFRCWRKDCDYISNDKTTPQGLALTETNHMNGHAFRDWKKGQPKTTLQTNGSGDKK